MKSLAVLLFVLVTALADPPPIQPREALGCGRHRLNAGAYYIESPNYSDDYPNNYNCRYKIRARDGSAIDFSCESFNLEEHRRCRYDYLKIGRTKYCGNDGPPGMSSTRLKIKFHTDFSVTESGFRCWLSVGGVTPPSTTAATTAATTAGTTVAPSTSCCCGVPNRSSRIVGGQETDVYEYPWQAGLVRTSDTRTWCGGTIINSIYVLTAAHCTAGRSASGIEVLIKEHRISNNDGQIRKSVQEIINHPSYTSTSGSGYDFSLLKLSEAISFPADNTVAPACLPSDASNQYVGVDAVVTGWGKTSSGGSQATALREVTVPVISNPTCSQSYSSINPSMICAGLSEGGKDSCQGDGGGPMVTFENDRYFLIGVVSWGHGCALPGYPGVYARVTEILSWIQTNSADGIFCS